MNLTVLGTGAADGWPNPRCSCASCASARTSGRLRGRTAALLDGVLLLDGGLDTPSAAERAEVDLTRLRHVLVTHLHPDRWTSAGLLFGSSGSAAPLDVVGPPDVVEQARTWVTPRSSVRFVPVAAGDRVRLGEYDVRVLAAQHVGPGGCVIYDVTGPGGRLFFAPHTGPLPDESVAAVAGVGFEVVLLEETFGDHTTHDSDHLDLSTFPEQLRRLREAGAFTRDTDVVAVHLSHRNPPEPELSRRLADWGARVVDDGTRLDRGHDGTAARSDDRAGRTLVLGGARSGKSREAERLLAAESDVTYVATAYRADHDDEWADRVRRHRASRPAHWSTVETLDLVPLLDSDGGPLLVDCLTLWLTRLLDRHDAWDDAVWAATGEKAVDDEVDALIEAWRTTRRRAVAVSNEVGQGVVPGSAAGRRFRDQMGLLNARVAAVSEDVRWCVAGRVTQL